MPFAYLSWFLVLCFCVIFLHANMGVSAFVCVSYTFSLAHLFVCLFLPIWVFSFYFILFFILLDDCFLGIFFF